MGVSRKRARRNFNKAFGRYAFKNRKFPIKIKVKLSPLLNQTQRNTSYTVSTKGDVLRLKFKKICQPTLDGYRIINLDQLQNHVSEITTHSALCYQAQICALNGRPVVKLATESKRQGLASVIEVQCQGCGDIFKLNTSPKTSTSENRNRYDINLRAVWGSMVTGSGLAHLSECLGTMGIPTMSQPTFSAIESEIGQWWCDILKKDMLRAGAEEKRLAMERNDYHQGVPAITVVCDGGWSKRSHKHTYNALGGVGIVIGLATRKLLHIGVRNKFCYICATAEGQQRDPVDHECFKNWEESSQAMEADVIVEAFSKAEHDHGVRYMRLIADGDSSVFARIQETVPVWGPYVTKLECANHACKCLRSNLEKLVDRKTQYKGKGKLTQAVRVRLVSAVRCAIRMRSEDLDRQSAARKLAHDIQNSVFHVFGQHDNCSEFCKRMPKDQQPPTLMMSTDSQCHESDENQMVIQVLNNQHAFWTDGSSLLSQDQSRIAISGTTLTSIEKQIIDDVRPILQRVASKSSRLLGNFTTNLAEAWMNVRAKFDGGKFFNRCQRGSWHARCYGGALRQNLGVAWSPTVWKKVTNTDPTTAFTVLYDSREKKIQQTRMLAARPVQKARRWKKKMQRNRVSASRKAQQEYGPAAIDVVPDVSPDDLDARMTAFVQSHLNIGAEARRAIEENTHAQSHSDLWQSERRKRLTSSNFGDIIKRNTRIPIQPIIKRLLYGNFKGNKFTSVGLASEAATIVEYKAFKYAQGDPVSVEPKGLCIDDNYPFLAASTDGLITSATDGQQGLLEVKNLLQNKRLTFPEAAKSVQNFCLAVVNGKLQLKTSHKYFFQIQGQLNIFNLDWADFVVRATNPHQLHVQRVHQDKNLWQTSMLPKLKAFYFKCLLPELAVPRHGKSPGIREPGNWFSSSNRNQSKAHTSSNISQRSVISDSSTPSTSNTTTVLPRWSSSNRVTHPLLVGRRISHKWFVDEASGIAKWYNGTVLQLVRGVDGHKGAVYNVQYDSEDDAFEVDHLVEDFEEKSVTFIGLDV